MTAKEQKIKEAYGEYWENVKNHLTDSNWFKSKELFGDIGNTKIRREFSKIEWECMDNYHPIYCYYFRPKSLQGIENNNGWIKIESEEDLPKEQIKVWFITNEEIAGTYHPLLKEFRSQFGFYNYASVTHYQPIIKPLKPIY